MSQHSKQPVDIDELRRLYMSILTAERTTVKGQDLTPKQEKEFRDFLELVLQYIAKLHNRDIETWSNKDVSDYDYALVMFRAVKLMLQQHDVFFEKDIPFRRS